MYIVIMRTHMSMQDINVRMVDSMFGMETECGLVGFCRGMLAGTSGDKRGGAFGADEGRRGLEQTPRTASNEKTWHAGNVGSPGMPRTDAGGSSGRRNREAISSSESE